MPDRFTPEEFARLLAHWAPEERAIYEERMAGNYTRVRLERFNAAEAALMAAVLGRLIPESEGLDLVGFIDAHAETPHGRGDRQPGMPGPTELFRAGLAGIEASAQALHARAYGALSNAEQDALLRAVADGSAPPDAWPAVPSGYFFERFHAKALQGYFAHPRVWMRIGFMGSAYPEGYVWLSKGEVRQRHERRIGWDTL